MVFQSVRKVKKPLQNSTNIGQIDEQCEILSEKVNQIDELKNEIAKLKQRNTELEELTFRLEAKQRNLEEVNQKLIGRDLKNALFWVSGLLEIQNYILESL